MKRAAALFITVLLCVLMMAGCSEPRSVNAYTYDHMTIELPEGFTVDESGSFPIMYSPNYPEESDNINITKAGADNIDNYSESVMDSVFSSSLVGYTGMLSYEETTVDGLDAILCSYGVSMSGVDMVGTQCYVFGRDYTDILTLTSVSGAYDDDFEACLKSISMH